MKTSNIQGYNSKAADNVKKDKFKFNSWRYSELCKALKKFLAQSMWK